MPEVISVTTAVLVSGLRCAALTRRCPRAGPLTGRFSRSSLDESGVRASFPG